MCSKTLNHSDSLRGECADQCVSPCCEGNVAEEIKREYENEVNKATLTYWALLSIIYYGEITGGWTLFYHFQTKDNACD